MIEARPAKLDDWPAIRLVLERLAASRFSAYVNSSPEEAGNFLANSLCFPHNVGFLVEHWGVYPVGISALLLIDSPKAGVPGIGVARHAFIHSVFIDPSLPDGTKVPSEAGLLMMEAIEKWAVERGGVYVFGNVRMDGHFDAFYKKYGMERQHYVVGKAIGGGNG